MDEIQRITLGIYKDVKKILDSHGLRYFAIGGTCVGAIRSKGFIPWDDELDIAMPIEDYLKFIDLCKTDLPAHLSLFSPEDLRHDYMRFIKIMDNRTTMIEQPFFTYKDIYGGAWIDVMPMSGVPSDPEEQKKFVRWVTRIYPTIISRSKRKMAESQSLKSKLLWLALSPLRILPKGITWHSWIKFLASHPFDGAEYTGYTWSNALARLIFPIEWFSDYVDMPFEDTTIRCPVGYDNYLTQQFGDYMQLPPKEKQFAHHDFAVFDLEHSYKDYQSGKLDAKEASKTMSKKGIVREKIQ